jgi:hypothetical protein
VLGGREGGMRLKNVIVWPLLVLRRYIVRAEGMKHTKSDEADTGSQMLCAYASAASWSAGSHAWKTQHPILSRKDSAWQMPMRGGASSAMLSLYHSFCLRGDQLTVWIKVAARREQARHAVVGTYSTSDGVSKSHRTQ